MVNGTRYTTKNFGKLVVSGVGGRRKAMVTFIKTGYECEAMYTHIRNGSVKDPMSPHVHGVGFFGVGIYKATDNGKKTKAYQRWSDMIKRCYNKTSIKDPTYKDCSVCEEWHNFQNFASWYKENYPTDGSEYELDKDIKVEGNRVYSYEFCIFVSKRENISHSLQKEYKMISPLGVVVNIKNMTDFCEKTGLVRSSMYRVVSGKRSHHRGWRLPNE